MIFILYYLSLYYLLYIFYYLLLLNNPFIYLKLIEFFTITTCYTYDCMCACIRVYMCACMQL